MFVGLVFTTLTIPGNALKLSEENTFSFFNPSEQNRNSLGRSKNGKSSNEDVFPDDLLPMESFPHARVVDPDNQVLLKDSSLLPSLISDFYELPQAPLLTTIKPIEKTTIQSIKNITEQKFNCNIVVKSKAYNFLHSYFILD